ncbi:MAG TPA: hypothetical protein VHQ04_06265 [Puia sp.]|nr:hypothetical protein [Puia sp.]
MASASICRMGDYCRNGRCTFFGRRLKKIQYLLTSFDALGLGFFTIIGIQKGLLHSLTPGFV